MYCRSCGSHMIQILCHVVSDWLGGSHVIQIFYHVVTIVPLGL